MTTVMATPAADELRADFLRAQQVLALARRAQATKDTPAIRKTVAAALTRIDTTLDLYLVLR